ncbi:MAG: hypothetical protein ACQEV0_03960 [Bacillota bacterium]
MGGVNPIFIDKFDVFCRQFLLGESQLPLGLSFRIKPGRTPVLLLRFTLGAELLFHIIVCVEIDWIGSVFCIGWVGRLAGATNRIFIDRFDDFCRRCLLGESQLPLGVELSH